MRNLFYISLVLPTIYVATVLSFFVGLPFGFDLAVFISPHNSEVMIAVGVLTFGFIVTCCTILWAGNARFQTKIVWSILLFLGNMFAVPYFLWKSIRGTVEIDKTKNKEKI